VLVDGAPGVGKTTLCIKMSKDWACHRILTEGNVEMRLEFLQACGCAQDRITVKGVKY